MFNPIQDPILIFTIIALGMMLSSLLAEKLRIPDLVLLLVFGAVLGPNGLGVLERNSAITLFGEVGLLYIMFLAGLEIDLHRFAVTKHKSILFGLLTFAIPQLFGTLAGHYILGFNWSASLLLGSMFASHTLLAYPLASRLGISRTEPVSITVGATILTDTLALLVLAVIADSARGISLGITFWGSIALGMVALVSLTWFGIPRLTRWFMENFTETSGAQFLFVLITVCGCAYLSHFAKLEPIIGAFLAGAAFNRLIPRQSVLMNRIVFSGHTLFIPFFLVSVGMLVDTLTLVSTPRGWAVAAMMIVTVIVTKYAAAWFSGFLFGYDRDSRKVMFGLSVVQAAATLAAVLVGYNLKIFDETVLNGAIAMIMVTCPLGSWMVDQYGRKLAEKALPREHSTVTGQKLLIPVVHSDFAIQIMDLAFLLHDSSAGSTLHPMTIAHDDLNSENAVAIGEKLLAHCLSHAAAADMPVHPSIRVDINAADGIARAAKELHATTTLIGWESEQTSSGRNFGHVMKKLLVNCPSRLIFCRLVRPLNTTSRLLVLLDPLAEYRRDITALTRDIKLLSKQIGAEIRIYFSACVSEEFKMKITKAKPSRPLTLIDSETLSIACSTFSADVNQNDTLLIGGERRSGLLWSPTIDRIPQRMAAKHPSNNILVAYPALVDYEAEEEISSTRQLESGEFDLYSVELEQAAVLDNALVKIPHAVFPHNPTIQDTIRGLLTYSAKSYPVELAPGVVLLHVHCDNINKPLLAVAQGSFLFPENTITAHILLALFCPKAQSTEMHLRSLAVLAKKFNNSHFNMEVAKAHSAAAICNLLNTKPEVPSEENSEEAF